MVYIYVVEITKTVFDPSIKPFSRTLYGMSTVNKIWNFMKLHT